MSAQLICLRGSLEQSIIELTDGTEYSIGRESANQIEIPELEISRSHAVLCWEAGTNWLLQDLGSTNGTFVNGQRIDAQRLLTGDHIQIGETVFLFLGDKCEGPNLVQVEDGGGALTETVRLPPSSRAEGKYALLLSIAEALQNWETSEGLQRALLEILMREIPAQRGAILLLEPGQASIESSYGRLRQESSARISVSSFLLRKIVEEGGAILAHYDSPGETPVPESIRSAGIQSLIAVPIHERKQTAAVLYLDSLHGQPVLNATHLELAAAIAVLATEPLQSARRIERLEADKRRLEQDLSRNLELVGDSAPMRQACSAIVRIAPTESTVLILGESGTGKELAARAIHKNSRRAKGPFIAINCAAVTDTLLESELFGHERGAFTGAVAQKRGKIELAQNGTLFLDEIGELSLSLQAKLLRVLQEREFERVGGTVSIRVNIRLLAATNRNLPEMIAEGRFRGDLYYRLNVISLKMPPLRDRREDILPLALFFLTKFAAQASRSVRGFSPRARTAMQSYDWPGNIRELQNAVERGLVLGQSDWIELEDLPEEIIEVQPDLSEDSAGYHAMVLESKRSILRKAVESANGRYVEAAHALGLNAKYLHRLLRTYGLK